MRGARTAPPPKGPFEWAAGECRRVLALYTPALVLGFSPGREVPEADARAFLEMPAEPVPAGEMPDIMGVSDVMMLADGRVGACIVTVDADGTDVAYLVFQQVGDRRLLDEDIHFSPGM